ncbi:Hsp20/alpha crystallin family protein [Thalassotalea mangrovi]|uniref:SHSP domain-containing protein n=1 Tax=Thalassotalea mangrovi TaxID=2572245 RepID=A0A4U1B9Q7_9GAMM|nr:Hsp20/alpha crystallin family protein [Thalassotalea mangrovi]TKB46752.1 hypothetical protein E8M12_04125 [Thalassotalea mangrovi]
MTSSNGGELWDWRSAMPELAAISSKPQSRPNITTEEFADHYKVIAKFPGSLRDNVHVQIFNKSLQLSTSRMRNQLHSRQNLPPVNERISASRPTQLGCDYFIEFSCRVSSKLVHRHFHNGVLILILAKR